MANTSSASAAPSGVAFALANGSPVRSAMSIFNLLGRVAIVTGGHRGIGLEIALALTEAGAVVYCLDLAPQPDQDWLKVKNFAAGLPNLVAQGEVQKGRLEYMSCDVTKQKETWDLVEMIADKEGRIDICFANAGMLSGAEALDYPAADFQKILDVNINGVLYTAQAAGRQMVKRDMAGSIILTGSISASVANKGMHWTAYNTSKAAVVQMARSLACELGSKKIRVNTISPGYIYTDMTKAFLDDKPQLLKEWSSHNPLGRLGSPDELRGVALFLASDASTFCTGSDLIIDGGHCAW
ncbi:Short chain dehydrogenases/reductase notP' [Psilocybe cubensis]|uniref:Sorbose reductase sou1 n=2 Tax=Psilocybe cubensis TaxID=181762 RepID=A0A8H7XZS8_PSICU|nr:Short chain dehydrogenases/reductase notP' [Psilocybe cubensis]KAH9478795.1 Short chain dehydrogenases/reductase notP' [Psilocybe cubensis]